MPHRSIARGVSTSTLCGKDWPADVELMASDRVAQGQSAELFVSIRWPAGTRGDAVLSFTPRTDSSSGRIRFDGPEGETTRTFTESGSQFVPIHGETRTDGGQPDVVLSVRIGDDEREFFSLLVGPSSGRVEVRSADDDGPAPEFLFTGSRPRLRAVPEPAAEGSYRWVTDDPASLRLEDTEMQTVRVEGVGLRAARPRLAVFFKPDGEEDATTGVTAVLSTSFHPAEVRWTRDHVPAPAEVRTDQLLEMSVEMSAVPFRLVESTSLIFQVLRRDNAPGLRRNEILAFPSNVTPAPTGFLAVETRQVTRHELADGESFESVARAFRAFHAADVQDHVLIVERPGAAPDVLVLGWWPARTLPGSADAGIEFLLEQPGRFTVRSGALAVSETSVSPSEIPARVRLRLEGCLLDAHPAAGGPEPLPRIEVRGGGASVETDEAGRYELEGWFLLDRQEIVVDRAGVDPVRLGLEVAESGASVNVVLRGAGPALATATGPGTAAVGSPIVLNVADLSLVVHKIRGTVLWPDSRRLDQPDYRGSPLAGKRVYALPLEPGPTDSQAPSSTLGWDELKARPGILRSSRPGRFHQGELTEHDGAFEIKFIDLSADRRYLFWIAGKLTQGDVDVESPEVVVRTSYRTLRSLERPDRFDGGRMADFNERGFHLVEHRHALTKEDLSDRIRCGGAIIASDGSRLSISDGRALTFSDGDKLVEGLGWQCLPLVSVEEPADRRSAYALETIDEFYEDLEDRFLQPLPTDPPPTPRGFLVDCNDWVLDTRKIDDSIDLSQGTWKATWKSTELEASRHRRRCELLERTFMVHPDIDDLDALTNRKDAGSQPLWIFDAITLADQARISIPKPDQQRNRFENRSLDGRLTTILGPAVPRLLGVEGKRILLAPGHGFLDVSPPSSDLEAWKSTRGSYYADFTAVEDDNDSFMAANTRAALEPSGMKVDCVREIRDMTRPGVENPEATKFEPSKTRGFPRLWQQNPYYFFGLDKKQLVTGDKWTDLTADRGQDDKGIIARRLLAWELAAASPPLDIMLAIHTNAISEKINVVETLAQRNARADGARGTKAFYLHVQTSVSDKTEANTEGMEFAKGLVRYIGDRCHTEEDGTGHKTDSDVRETFPHSEEAGDVRVVKPAGTTTFPRRIPVALVEVAFHVSRHDAALLARGWFRRLAGEAMAFAVENQLRADTAAVPRALMIRILKAVFGPTSRVHALKDEVDEAGTADEEMTPAGIEDFVERVTGTSVPGNSATLDAAVNAVENARDASTRSDFVEALRDSLALVAGYATSDTTEIEQFVGPGILSGDAERGLSRGDRPITRAEAAGFIAVVLAWSPAQLETVIGKKLMTLLSPLCPDKGNPALAAEKFLPEVEVEGVLTDVRKLEPTSIYRLVGLHAEDDAGRELDLGVGSPGLTVHPGQQLTLVVDTEGVPWKVDLGEIEFKLAEESTGTVLELAVAETLRGIRSVPWDLPADSARPRRFTLTITVPHATQDLRLEHCSTFELHFVL